MNKYPLFSARNLPAYVTVVTLWLVVSGLIAIFLHVASGSAVEYGPAAVWSLVSVMCGMSIMFGASAVNLRKLRPGFERLAAGASDPEIPPVWCPVLTMATRAAIDLSDAVKKQREREQEMLR